MNLLKLQPFCAGPAHLLENPAPRAYFGVALLNLFIAMRGLIALFYGNYKTTSSVSGVAQYLVILGTLAWYSAAFYWRVSRMKELSVDEWISVISKGIWLNIVQACVMMWGILLCFKVNDYEEYVGSPMYFYLITGKWMTHNLLSLSILNSVCIVSSFYIVLITTLVYLMNKLFQKRFIR